MAAIPPNAAAPMAPAAANPNEAWRNFTKRASIDACKLTRNDLKLLFRLVDEKQLEYRDRVLGPLVQIAGETSEQFEQRRTKVRNAFLTRVSVTGENGHVVTGHGEAIFDSALVPDRIRSILYDTSFSPNAVLQHNPSDQATVLLDFSKPSLINFAAQPSVPTPNNSNWFISAETESWSTSLSTRLTDFFSERKTSVDWLHRPAAYDALLLVLGFPLALWGSYRLGNLFAAGRNFPAAINTAIYIYAFFLAANIFRGLFSYSRWIFPKIEMESPRSTAHTHRLLWYAIVLAVLGSAFWDGIKFLAN